MKNLKISDEAHEKIKNYCDVHNLKMNDWVSYRLIDLVKNHCYVEIAPRGCGKTTRLINAVKHYIDNDITGLQPAIVTHNKAIANIIRERLEIIGVDTSSIIFSDSMYCKSNGPCQFFVDEFDYIDRSKLFISDVGYYCGTLKNAESDEFTIQLYKTFTNSYLWKQ